MEMKLLILKILNHKIQEVKKIPLQYQAIIFSKMMQEDLNEEQYCRSYAFLIDESNKANVMGQEAAKTVYQQVKYKNFDPIDKNHKKI